MTFISQQIAGANTNISNKNLTIDTAGIRSLKMAGPLTGDMFDILDSTGVNYILRVRGDKQVFMGQKLTINFVEKSTGGALFVYGGGASDYISRWHNVSNISVIDFRTSSGGGLMRINDSTGSTKLTFDGQSSNIILLADGKNIAFGTGTGTKIAPNPLHKISVYGATPISQPAFIPAPSGGVTIDAEARTAIDSMRTLLINFGLTASS